MLKFRIFTKKS